MRSPATGADHRLPYDVEPRRYELVLSPDLERARFVGTVRVELEVLEATERIVMNAAELELSEAVVRPGWPSRGEQAPGEAAAARVELDPEHERVAFVLGRALAPGRHHLDCRFEGVLNDRLHGFYRSVYTDRDGIERVIATTQFENTDARRAFPCLDEPDRKAVFSVTLDEPPGMLAISNGAELAATDLPGGGRRVRFSDTMPMSTYLVAFVVGPLEATEAVDAGGIPVRVVHAPGRGHLVQPALDAAVHALAYFQDYFALAYPGDKVDLVALPDFAAGAMENLGCITFREAILLADRERSGRRELERLAEVIEHELAHMWFGDLVTMRWWNGIWLNEAFATFMALRCLDDYRPDWEVFTGFAKSRLAAQQVDGLHSTRAIEYEVREPDEVAAMFDVLTYQKGASVLWMVEQHLGAERFRDGVRRYLADHRYASTETGDLWEALRSASLDGEVPIGELMDSWIFQGGYPLVTASPVAPPSGAAGVGAGTAGSGARAAGGAAGIELSQQPFAYLPAERAAGLGLVDGSAIGADWVVPVVVAPAGAAAKASPARGGSAPLRADRLLLRSDPSVLAATGLAPCVVNANGCGFYRVAYEGSLRAGLLGELPQLSALERFGILSDTWAGVLAGRRGLGELGELVGLLGAERDPEVWSMAVSALATLDVVAPDELRAGLASYVSASLSPVLDAIGITARQGEGEGVPLLRAVLLGALGNLAEDPAAIATAQRLARDDLAGVRAVPADLAPAALAVLVAHGGRDDLGAVVARWRADLDPMDAVRHLYALSSVRDPELAGEVLDLAVGEVRTQNAPYLIGYLLANRHVAAQTWAVLLERFDELVERFPSSSVHRMLEGLPGLARLGEDGKPAYLDEVVAFYRERVRGGRRRLVAQSVERLVVWLEMAARAREELPALGSQA